jgi:nucleoside phosphorylase
MTVVTFALPAESSAFIRSFKGIRRDGAILRGTLEDRPRLRSATAWQAPNIEHRKLNVCVLHTGVGPSKCEDRVGNFLRHERPQLLIASGFCGGTSHGLHPGDLVIAENASAPTLLMKAHATLPNARIGKIHSADRIIDPAADRYAIGRQHDAVAVDMETETITRLCAAESIPMLALRVVSDSPAAPFPAPPNVLFDVERQRTNFSLLLSYIARNPASALRLAQFSSQITRAKTRLADALIVVLREL